jgi:hypothetical protein
VPCDRIEIDAAVTLEPRLRFVSDLARSPWSNLARATGDLAEDGTADEDTADLSDDGTDADPNDNGDPGGPGEDDPKPLPPFPGEARPIPASGPLPALALGLLGAGRLSGTV